MDRCEIKREIAQVHWGSIWGEQISHIWHGGINSSHGVLGRQNCRAEKASRCLSCSSLSSPLPWLCLPMIAHLSHPLTVEKVWEAVLVKPTRWDARCLRSALLRETSAHSSVHMSSTPTADLSCPTVLDPSTQTAARPLWTVSWWIGLRVSSAHPLLRLWQKVACLGHL